MPDLLWAAEVLLGRYFGTGGTGALEADEAQARADLRRLAQLQEATTDARIARSRKLEALGRIAKADVAGVRILDENGLDVSDASLDPVRELETPQEERYSVVLDRADGSGTSVSFLFLSGEPAAFARNRLRQLLAGTPAE